jgi:predicted permease
MSDHDPAGSHHQPRLPRFGLILLRLRFPGDTGEALTGDLIERFEVIIASGQSIRSARAWFRRQVLRSAFSRMPRRGLSAILGRTGNRNPTARGQTPGSQFGGRPNRIIAVCDNLTLAFRQAARTLSRRPLMTLISAFSLALGIGACTIIFSITWNTTIRSLPFPDPEELVGINRLTPQVTGSHPSLATLNRIWMTPYALYHDWAELSTSFSDIGAYAGRDATLTGAGEAQRCTGMRTTSGVFAALGIEAAFGRVLLPEDDAVGAPPVTMLSHAIWQSRFGADPAVIGQEAILNGTPYTIVGVMPRGFLFPYEGVAFWFNLFDEEKTSDYRAGGYLKVIARLRPGVSIEQAQAEMDGIVRHLAEEYPAEEEHGIRLTGYHQLIVGGSNSGLIILIGAVIMVLLITCANIAGLLLVRAIERRRELAVRAALGAGRRNLITQSLAESLLLALLGGLLGLTVAVAGLRPFVALFPGNLPPTGEIRVDSLLFVIALMLTVAVGIVIGLVPALRTARIPAMATIRDASGRASGGRRRNRTQAGLVVTQVMLSFALLTGAVLLVKSYRCLNQVDPGFEIENMLIMDVVLPNEYRDSRVEQYNFFTSLFEQLGTLPGLTGVTAVEQVPMFSGLSFPPVHVETSSGTTMESIHIANVSPSYFDVMDIPILSGRGLASTDRYGTQPVAVINRTLADRYWPEEDPIGRRINIGSEEEPSWLNVVGVSADVRYRPQMAPFPEFYVSINQFPQWYLSVLMKTAVDPRTLAGPARETVRELDADIPIDAGLYADRIKNSQVLQRSRIGAWAMGMLALVAALLTIVGLYGTLAFVVAHQTREIGIRIALGAGHSRLIRSVLRRGLVLVLIGLTLGLGIALTLSGLIEASLFGIQPTDPLTLAEVALLIIAAGLAASWLPAHRATAVDPINCLRQE